MAPADEVVRLDPTMPFGSTTASELATAVAELWDDPAWQAEVASWGSGHKIRQAVAQDEAEGLYEEGLLENPAIGATTYGVGSGSAVPARLAIIPVSDLLFTNMMQLGDVAARATVWDEVVRLVEVQRDAQYKAYLWARRHHGLPVLQSVYARLRVGGTGRYWH